MLLAVVSYLPIGGGAEGRGGGTSGCSSLLVLWFKVSFFLIPNPQSLATVFPGYRFLRGLKVLKWLRGLESGKNLLLSNGTNR